MILTHYIVVVLLGAVRCDPGCLTGLRGDSRPGVFSGAAILFLYCAPDEKEKEKVITLLLGGAISGKNFF